MSVGLFKDKVNALSGEHSLDVLMFLYENGWSIALEVARGLDIHSTTAMNYLSKMHKAGLISRRVKKRKTGNTYEYKLKSNKIELCLDMTGSKSRSENIAPAINLILKITEELNGIGNPITPGFFKDKQENEIFTFISSGKEEDYANLTREKSEALFNILRKLIDYSEKSLGKPITRRILISASHSLPSSMLEFMPDYVQEVIT